MKPKLVAQAIADSYLRNGKKVAKVVIDDKRVTIIFTDKTSIEATGVYAEAIRTGKLFA